MLQKLTKVCKSLHKLLQYFSISILLQPITSANLRSARNCILLTENKAGRVPAAVHFDCQKSVNRHASSNDIFYTKAALQYCWRGSV